MLLVNRDGELDRLKTAFAQCADAGSRTVIVEGGVGCGKSALLAALADHAVREGATVLRARGMGGDTEPSLRVLDQLAAQLPWAAPPGVPQPDAARHFAEALHQCAAKGPVVICVDDTQDVDRPSLYHLLQTAGRGLSSRTLLVFADSPHLPQQDPLIRTELLRQPDALRIRLGPLDEGGVGALVAAADGDPGDRSLVAHLHRVSAGNPLLLRALLEDCLGADTGARPVTETQPEPGGMYGQAVLTCLYRSGPTALRLGHAIAVLAEAATPELLGRVSELPAALVDQHLRALRAAGVVDGCRFRHRAAAATVLAGMDPPDHSATHRRAAAALHDVGTSPSVIASLLLPARGGAEPWEQAVLWDAAEKALAADDATRAISLLELALETCQDEAERIEIRLRLALITWRVSPALAEYRHLPELLDLMRDGALSQAGLAALTGLLAAYGRAAEAREAVALQGEGSELEPGRDPDPGPDPDPGAPGDEAEHGGRDDRDESSPDAAVMWVRYGLQAQDFPEDQSADGVVGYEHAAWAASAENFLEATALTDATLGPVCNAIRVLVFTDRLERAWNWAEIAAQESARRGIPGWQAVFGSVQGIVASRQGRLETALECMAPAREILPERSRSVLTCEIDSVLAYVHTETGRFDDAARIFDRPVPETWEKSLWWLGYLQTRGRFLLATNRPHTALSDFLRVGKATQGLGIDHPLLVPWRTDVAEAWLRLKDPEQAAALLAEQDRSEAPATRRSRGTSLRLRAALAPVEDRPGLLGTAVELLHAAGDRLELAKAFADLGDAHHALGDSTRAAAAQRRAWLIAKECGALPLCRRLEAGGRGGAVRERAAAGNGGESPTAGNLSWAERRVAALAAHGRSNREISQRLYITVSTVEQHLTRVYQKLGISRREEIPVDL